MVPVSANRTSNLLVKTVPKYAEMDSSSYLSQVSVMMEILKMEMAAHPPAKLKPFTAATALLLTASIKDLISILP